MSVLVASLLVAAMTVPTAPSAHAATVFDDFDGPAGAAPDSDKWGVVEGTDCQHARAEGGVEPGAVPVWRARFHHEAGDLQGRAPCR